MKWGSRPLFLLKKKENKLKKNKGSEKRRPLMGKYKLTEETEIKETVFRSWYFTQKSPVWPPPSLNADDGGKVSSIVMTSSHYREPPS